MKNKSQHLKLADRERIALLKTQGLSNREVSRKLGIDHTTVGREIKRNRNQETGEYLPIKANRKARKRAKLQRESAPLKNPEVYLYVKNKLRMFWSPEQIAGRIRIDLPGEKICHETIYSFIYNQAKHPHEYLDQYLLRATSKRRKRTGRGVKKVNIPGKIMINERSPLVMLRDEFGHFETDLIEGKRSDDVEVSSTVERKTRFTLLTKLNSKSAREKPHQF